MLTVQYGILWHQADTSVDEILRSLLKSSQEGQEE